MTCSDVLNIVALIIVPIIAVVIGQYLQERSEKRKDKMRVFMATMTFRYGWSREGVEALNSIPVVFSGKRDAEVREKWKIYFDFLCVQNPDEMQIKKINNALFKLLESMAMVLGYKGVITWEDIQNPYIPVGMVNAIKQNEIIQNGMMSLVIGMNNANANKTNRSMQENSQKEEAK